MVHSHGMLVLAVSWNLAWAVGLRTWSFLGCLDFFKAGQLGSKSEHLQKTRWES